MRVGDRVRIERRNPPSGTWSRYSGREGRVARIHREQLPKGSYVEIGVSWALRRPIGDVRADAWFLPSEVVKL